ncbi:MAG: P-loop NTPase [Phycisphaerae bacterium]|nr:P-loop NTPase [Phycisphaerae bacterium]
MEREELSKSLKGIQHKIVVLSGKGGVGKSTVATNLALSLAESGKQVGLLDVDIHGPSVPALLGIGRKQVVTKGEKILPIMCGGMKVMSIGFLLPDDRSPVIWRGPMKMSLIKQFLKDVDWRALDYLIIDCPPGTGDEPLSVAQLIEHPTGAIVVTTPQEVALLDVRKSITFCGHLGMPVLGVVENMSGFVCPHCGKTSDIFRQGGGERMAEEMGVPFLARIPIDPGLVLAGDQGEAIAKSQPTSPAAEAFGALADAVTKAVETPKGAGSERPSQASKEGDGAVMRFAIPLANGQLCMHFGHCEEFAFVDVDRETKTIQNQTRIAPPEHEPGILPPWIKEQGADLVIAGGMGQRAQQIFAQHGVDVLVGAPAESPEALVQAYLDGSLQSGENVCDH